MHDTGLWVIAIGLAWLIIAAFWPSKRTSFIRLPRLVKATKTKQGTTYSAFLPAKPKLKSARKRKR